MLRWAAFATEQTTIGLRIKHSSVWGVGRLPQLDYFEIFHENQSNACGRGLKVGCCGGERAERSMANQGREQTSVEEEGDLEYGSDRERARL